MDIKVKTKKVGGWEKDKWENYIRNKSETYKEKKKTAIQMKVEKEKCRLKIMSTGAM